MKKIKLILLLLFYGSIVKAQMPDTEIYIIAISHSEDGEMRFGTPVNITDKAGYDNQPVFTSNSDRIIYVSQVDSNQTDLFEYDIKKETTTLLGTTEESEYSPGFVPLSNEISVVRVDKDKSQKLYSFETNPAEAYMEIEGLDSIGYYRWINDTILGLVVLNNGLELYIYELTTRQYVIADKNVGRCLMIDPGSGNLLYTKPSGDGPVQIMIADKNTFDTELFVEGYKNSEDYLITPGNEIWTGSDGLLYSMNLKKRKEWRQIADFSKTVGSFYRLAISPDGKYLALVSYKGSRP